MDGTPCDKITSSTVFLLRCRDQLDEKVKKARTASERAKLVRSAQDLWAIAKKSIIRAIDCRDHHESCGTPKEVHDAEISHLRKVTTELWDTHCPCKLVPGLACGVSKENHTTTKPKRVKRPNLTPRQLKKHIKAGKTHTLATVTKFAPPPASTELPDCEESDFCRHCLEWERNDIPLVTCAKCIKTNLPVNKRIVYCSTICAKNDWPEHKKHHRTVEPGLFSVD